jgi:hypothetical protein
MKKIIAFCGVIGSGKDYEANKYIDQEYKLINFADALKKILFKTLKIKNIDHQKYELFKDSHWNPIGMFPSVTGRDLLQLGNYARHIIDENIWVNAWENSIQNESLIVTSDCRYLNEAKKITHLDSWQVHSSWAGFYLQSNHSEVFTETIDNVIHIVNGIGGKGMTTSPGFTHEYVQNLYS